MTRVRQLFSSTRGKVGLFAVSASITANIVHRYRDEIEEQDAFSEHTAQQFRKHLISGMHDPLLANAEQLALFNKHFPEHAHLLPTSVEMLREEESLRIPVKIKPIADCPVVMNCQDAGTLVVGGPPALMSAASLIKQDKNITYIYDKRKRPIAFGSAFHLEEDAETEAPTSYRPSQFLASQVWRTAFGYVSHQSIEQTGMFPWATLDWIGWIKHPELWAIGIRLAIEFEKGTRASKEKRQALVFKIAAQCQENEKFYDTLNKEVGGQLLMSGKGSIIVARNDEEVLGLQKLQRALKNEDRTLAILSRSDMIKRYGFAPNGMMFGEKTHDRILSPQFRDILTQYIASKGGKVLNGTLVNVYTDKNITGGIAEYRLADGRIQFMPFSRLIMSLGTQPVVDVNNNPLFGVVSARGVSVLAHVSVPEGCQLPPAIVCGGTNHVIKLSEKPVTIDNGNGMKSDLYLMRMTAGACITPNVSDERAVNYDGTIAHGLMTAVRKTFGDSCTVEPIMVYGCNRQVSQYGQTNWINPFPGVHIQYGAGGGGLTRAPDYSQLHGDMDQISALQLRR